MDILVGGQPHRPWVLPEDAREDKDKEHRQARGTRGRARCLSGDGLRGIGAYFSIKGAADVADNSWWGWHEDLQERGRQNGA